MNKLMVSSVLALSIGLIATPALASPSEADPAAELATDPDSDLDPDLASDPDFDDDPDAEVEPDQDGRRHCVERTERRKARGVRALWHVECEDGDAFVSGWVMDTRDDGRCAQLGMRAKGTRARYARVCGRGRVDHFQWRFPNDRIKVKLEVR